MNITGQVDLQGSGRKHHWNAYFKYNAYFSDGRSHSGSITVVSDVKEGHHGVDVTGVSMRVGKNWHAVFNSPEPLQRYTNLARQLEAPNMIQPTPAPVDGTLQVLQNQLAVSNQAIQVAQQTINDLNQKNERLVEKIQELQTKIAAQKQLIAQLEVQQTEDHQYILELNIQLRTWEAQLIDYLSL
jgi:hypothetical protein